MHGLRDGALPSLQTLELSGADIGDEGVKDLLSVLSGPGPCTSTLRWLDLSRNDIRARGMDHITRAFLTGSCPHLRHLHLSGNLFSEEGMIYMADALAAGALPELRELDLHSVGAQDTNIAILSHTLSNPVACPQLQTLKIHGNYSVTESAIQILLDVVNASRPHGQLKIQWKLVF